MLILRVPCLPGEMPEAQICIHLNWIRDFRFAVRPPEQIQVALSSGGSGLIPDPPSASFMLRRLSPSSGHTVALQFKFDRNSSGISFFSLTIDLY